MCSTISIRFLSNETRPTYTRNLEYTKGHFYGIFVPYCDTTVLDIHTFTPTVP